MGGGLLLNADDQLRAGDAVLGFDRCCQRRDRGQIQLVDLRHVTLGVALPIAVIATFIPMYYLQISSNIMSLGGLALAIGVLVDASIVMVENGYRQLSEAQHQASLKSDSVSVSERQRILLSAAIPAHGA